MNNPTIGIATITQPAANVVNIERKKREEGYTVRILGEGSNGGTITYQWYKDNVAIEGETNATCTPDVTTAGTFVFVTSPILVI